MLKTILVAAVLAVVIQETIFLVIDLLMER
jgi:hypothetical protein